MRFPPLTIAGLVVLLVHVALGQIGIPHVGLVAVIAALELVNARTRAFLYMVAPILLYVVLYDLVRYIPHDWRSRIDVECLYRADEFIFRGTLPHQWLGYAHTTWKDILAAIPYNCHFLTPLLFGVVMWRLDRSVLRSFCWSFAFMNIAALMTQQLFPTAAPWYYQLYGFFSASHAMPGNPAGLARVDALLGFSYFTDMYRQSTVVFGALPSMHAAWPALAALWSWRVSHLWCGLWVAWALWMWWAAVYLQHHYVVDLLAGLVFAVGAFQVFQKFERVNRQFYVTDETITQAKS